MSRCITLSLLVFLLAGCVKSVPTNYYLLQDDINATQTFNTSRSLAIDKIEIAGFLDKSGVVYQTGPNQVNVAVRHLWAEPLSSQLRRSLSDQLSENLIDIAVYQNKNDAPDTIMLLNVSIDGFHGRYDGIAKVSGTWWLTDQKAKVVTRRAFDQSVPLQSDGYPELVRALSLGLEETVAMIAEAVQTH